MPELLQCPFCPKTSTRGTGLSSHIRGNHPAQYAGWVKARKGVAPTTAAAAPVRRGPGRPPSAAKAALGKSGAGTVSLAGIPTGFGDIVAMLERERNAIETALIALRPLRSR